MPSSDAAPSTPTLVSKKTEEDVSWFVVLTTYMAYGLLIFFGHIRDFFGKLTGISRYFRRSSTPKVRSQLRAARLTDPAHAPPRTPLPQGYAPLLQDWESFFTRRMYHRIQDCWNRPIAGPPFSARMRVLDREFVPSRGPPRVVGADQFRECINLGSYNYLGFADDWNTTCRAAVVDAAARFPVSLCASGAEGGYSRLHRDLEARVADYVGKPSAIIFNMGWATNALGLPAIIGGKGTLIISDSLNHNSIVSGARLTGSVVRVFRHNDLDGLRALVRSAISEGQDRTHRPWKKILIAVEGIYSMEGEFCDLKGVVKIAKEHRCYVYLDEAHSIGATGRTGRGVCEHAGVDPRDVDLLMGTFTKSFGAMGGYIAGSRELISWIRRRSAGFLLDNVMSPVVVTQVLQSLRIMRGDDGTKTGERKLAQLRSNSNYLRSKLREMGLDILGDEESPVIPMLIYHPNKVSAFSRECLKRGVRTCVRPLCVYKTTLH
jgi:serine palmitoyltransferase